MGVSPERYQEAKATRVTNGDGRDGRGVGASSVSALLMSYSAENGAVSGSPAVDGLDIPLGVLTGRDILSCPSWQARRMNGLPEGDSANQGER